jgi:hypothetical protein
MSNVKLTKAQAEAIECVKENGAKATMISMHATNENRWSDVYKALNGMPLDVLVKAVYEGYDVKEERVVVDPDIFRNLLAKFEEKEDYYDTHADRTDSRFYDGKANAYSFAGKHLQDAMREAGISFE